MGRRRFLPAGLLIAAAIFGHDLLMAGDAHGMTSSPHEHGMMVEQTGRGPIASGGHVHDSGDCGTLRAVLEQRQRIGHDLLPAVPVGEIEDDVHPASLSPESPRTLWPPGVRRAFLQVYRI
jgi:hypothetical protein